MAGPLIVASRILRGGKQVQVFRRGGVFAKAKDYLRQERAKEAYLRSIWGSPPSGNSWLLLAGKYPDRFEEYLEGFDG